MIVGSNDKTWGNVKKGLPGYCNRGDSRTGIGHMCWQNVTPVSVYSLFVSSHLLFEYSVWSPVALLDQDSAKACHKADLLSTQEHHHLSPASAFSVGNGLDMEAIGKQQV